ncbi:alpha-crystallin A chain-like [Macrosteles quadrilineatus]|uniref:alpha-crystallin A chain-like n=1 Tax=Macrosteles quadrilineatus TaxID=74068 RepID=UPI0023E0D777|nr:alpha-crystallin A chain-like [Macrosteles quadrilineatus]XP_054262451.1 alpha-crystallin A chain-like [Macrosteles quadrilineatus]
MSILPYLLNDLLQEAQRPSLHDQHFGLGLLPSDLIQPEVSVLSMPLRSGYMRPWRTASGALNSGTSCIASDKDTFRINLDVQQFRPEELSVKIVDDFIVIEGKHEERSDEHGFVSRQFTRRYKLPADVNREALKSHLSSDGVLQLEAPKVQKDTAKGISIPITQTNKPAVKQAPKTPTAEQNGEKMES